MALLWFDGYESYTNFFDVEAVRSPTVASMTYYNARPTIGNYGRNGSRGIMIGYIYGQTINFNSTYSSLVVGIAVVLSAANTGVYNVDAPMFITQEGGTPQLRFHIVGTEIQVRRGDETLLGTTSGAGIEYDVWRYIEIKFTIDNSSGSVVIRSSEQVVLNLSGVDTQNTANAYVDNFTIGCGYGTEGGMGLHFDDLYICDTTGSKNNDFLGDIRVDILRPDGAGTYSQFTPSAGSNYENVDETYGPDDDTTYNEADTTGYKDSYNLGSLSSPPSGEEIFGVKSQITVRKTDAGAKGIKLLTKSGSTEDLSDKVILSDSFITHTNLYEVNPDDSNDWEDADVNAMEIGVVIVAVTTTTT